MVPLATTSEQSTRGWSPSGTSTVRPSRDLGESTIFDDPERSNTTRRSHHTSPAQGIADTINSSAKLYADSEGDHIFSQRQKWCIVYLVSLAGSFSPLSSNIYFPAIGDIGQNLGVGSSQVLLTVTVYMIVQGISPSIFGALSDIVGRRLIFTLMLIIYTGANLALAFTENFAMLLVLRGVQAAGSAATISISTGVIADIAKPRERGRFMGTNAGIRMIGQAIGPVIGGALNSAWGFRSIFLFLFSLSTLVLVLLIVFLPETQREIAGNGSVPLGGLHKPLIYLVWAPKEWANKPYDSKPLNLSSKPRVGFFKRILAPLKHVLAKDIAVLLLWGATVYTIWSMVTSSTTTVLQKTFPDLTQWQIGLCFLPNGMGCVLGSISTGYFLDKIFKKVEAQYKPRAASKASTGKHARIFLLSALAYCLCRIIVSPSLLSWRFMGQVTSSVTCVASLLPI